MKLVWICYLMHSLYQHLDILITGLLDRYVVGKFQCMHDVPLFSPHGIISE